MASTPTTRLRVETQALGENLNTWGDTRLNEALKRLEEGIAGLATIPIVGTSTTLTSVNYSTDEARNACLVFTGTLTANSTVTVPNVEKLYLAVNLTSGSFSLTLKTAAGGGYALRSGPQWVRCDGSDVISATPRLDQLPAPTAAVDLNSQKITGLGTPTLTTDAATKTYVDTVAGGAAAQYFPGDGTAAAPAYSFASDTNTGVYRVGTDSVGVSTGGTVRLTVDATGIATVANIVRAAGSSGVPGFGFVGDTGTGIRSYASNQLSLLAGGNDRVILDSAGNIGIALAPYVVADHRILAMKGETTGSGYSAVRLETGINSTQATFQIGGASGDVIVGTNNTNLTGSLSLFAGGSSRAQISSSGVLYVGNNTAAQPGHVLDQTGFQWIGNTAGTAGWAFSSFFRSGVSIGSITQSGTTGVSYNTTSDERLKDNIQPLVAALQRLMRLEPKRFNYKKEPGRKVDGFLAGDVQAVVPEAVTGKRNEVDADGNPVYQMIDQSKLIPVLVAAVQELVARVEKLERGHGPA
jgi:hypothetical protein